MEELKKVWLVSRDANGIEHWYMSSAVGGTVDMLPTCIEQGSDCFDLTTKTVYFFDGLSWN